VPIKWQVNSLRLKSARQVGSQAWSSGLFPYGWKDSEDMLLAAWSRVGCGLVLDPSNELKPDL